MAGKRANTKAWKGGETDRSFRARVESARKHGQYTPPGTKPNAMNPDKVKRKADARKAHR